MDTKETSRKDKMISHFLDTGTNSVLKWGDDFIETNLPKSMDWTADKFKAIVSSLKIDTNTKSKESFRSQLIELVKIGENNKERALILAMQEQGIDNKTIHEILDKSNKYLITDKTAK